MTETVVTTVTVFKTISVPSTEIETVVTTVTTETEFNFQTTDVFTTTVTEDITITTDVVDPTATTMLEKRSIGPIPSYATACKDAAAYSSACVCLGVTSYLTTSTITVATPTTYITIPTTLTATSDVSTLQTVESTSTIYETFYYTATIVASETATTTVTETSTTTTVIATAVATTGDQNFKIQSSGAYWQLDNQATWSALILGGSFDESPTCQIDILSHLICNNLVLMADDDEFGFIYGIAVEYTTAFAVEYMTCNIQGDVLQCSVSEVPGASEFYSQDSELIIGPQGSKEYAPATASVIFV